MKSTTGSAQRIFLLVTGGLAFIAVAVFVGFGFFSRNSDTMPTTLLEREFIEHAGVLRCNDTYTIEIENDDPEAAGLLIGDAPADINDFCGEDIIFTGSFQSGLGTPLCAEGAECPDSAAVVNVESMELGQ